MLQDATDHHTTSTATYPWDSNGISEVHEGPQFAGADLSAEHSNPFRKEK